MNDLEMNLMELDHASGGGMISVVSDFLLKLTTRPSSAGSGTSGGATMDGNTVKTFASSSFDPSSVSFTPK